MFTKHNSQTARMLLSVLDGKIYILSVGSERPKVLSLMALGVAANTNIWSACSTLACEETRISASRKASQSIAHI